MSATRVRSQQLGIDSRSRRARGGASAVAAGTRRVVRRVPSSARGAESGPPGWWEVVQRGWWIAGLTGGLVAALGFQTLPPSRRLAAVEAVNARQDSVARLLDQRNAGQDSVMAVHQRAQRLALDSISRQLGQLLAGQCAKERDRMARLLYGCQLRGS